MRTTLSSLDYLGARFQSLSEQAAILYNEDQAFRDLCDVHAICVRAVKRSEVSRPSALGAEYAAQQVRIEAELLRWLERPRGPARPRSTGRRARG